MGKGIVKLTLHGVRCTISNVYWIPELKNNPLSVRQLQEKGVVVLFKNSICSIYHPQKEKIAESIMSANRLFILHTEPFTKMSPSFKYGSINILASSLGSSRLQRLVHIETQKHGETPTANGISKHDL